MESYRSHHAGNILPITMIASAFIGFATFIGLMILPVSTTTVADMRIEPTNKTVVVDETFDVSIVVESRVPVNVFAGELLFDTNTLEVVSIDYNISIADLWAEEPWYSNGDGTLTFMMNQRCAVSISDALRVSKRPKRHERRLRRCSP